MHVNISQEPLDTDIYRYNAADQNRGAHFVRACAVEMHVGKFTGKKPPTKPAARTLCEPAQSKRTWTSHESNFMQKFTGKRPQTKSKQNLRRTCCASLRNQNAHGFVTGAILCGNLQEKCRAPK